MNFLKRIEILLVDFVRFNKTCQKLSCYLVELMELFSSSKNSRNVGESVGRLVKACRICPTPNHLLRLEHKLRRKLEYLDTESFDWDYFFPNTGPREITKGIILKRPIDESEKGVLFIAFEDQWLRLLRYANLEKLAEDYDLVLAPTWSPPHDFPFLMAVKKWPGKLFHILSNFDDLPVYGRLADNLCSIPLISSNWINPEIFDIGEPVEKEYEIAMLANFAFYKRHYLLFDVLRKMPPAIKALLLGRSIDDRTSQTIMEEARIFGVSSQIDIRENLPDKDMIAALRSAKVSLILSGNEGACIAVVESMFAGVPVGLFADANIGSKTYINRQTGALLNRVSFAEDLWKFIARYKDYSPREWVDKNEISCVGSTRILNDHLKKETMESGGKWTADIFIHHWRPIPKYFNPQDADSTAGLYEEFEREYDVKLVMEGVS